jgi:hypothetical protein
MNAIERRRDYRHPCNSPRKTGVLIDLSQTGAQYEIKQELQPGEELRVQVSKFDPLIDDVKCRVVNCRQLGSNVYRVHVKFENDENAVQQALQKYLTLLQLADAKNRK